jgi:hypothetical protein
MGDPPVALTGKEIWGLFQKGSPAQSMEVRTPHDFEHTALVPGPGNAEHFSLAFSTWRRMKVGKFIVPVDLPHRMGNNAIPGDGVK